MILDPGKMQLGMENKRLTSLLIAILSHTGEITLTAEEANQVWDRAELRMREEPNGGITLWVENPHMETLIRQREV